MRGREQACVMAAAAALLASCEKPAPPVITCRPPILKHLSNPSPEDLAHDAAANCERTAAFQAVGRGGPVAAAVQTAEASCAPLVDQYLQAYAAQRPLYPYQRVMLHDKFHQIAQITAAQKRSMGCGLPGGQAEKLR